jgi:acetyl-CoA synthetase
MRRLLKELVTTGKVSGNITTLEDFTVIDAIQKKISG